MQIEIKALKFGGSSLSSSSQFKKVKEIVESEDARRYVVASAPGKRHPEDEKITDLFKKCYKLAEKDSNIDGVFEKIKARYDEIIEDLALDFSLDDEFKNIKESILHQVGSDFITSRGEYLNAKILAEYLGYNFVDAEKRIFFFEDGSFDSQRTNLVLGKALSEHKNAVIPGFYGSMPNGTIRTFSRGGSDITGSIVASAANADLYENWTDVSGMLMADPRIVENPKVIDIITYRELRELSYMGASVMHEDVIFPVKQARIPINIRNTNSPQDKGTMIIPEVNSDNKDKIITGLAGKTGFSIINMEKNMMNQEVGFGRKVLEILENYNVPFEHLPTGIDTMSIVVNSKKIRDVEDLIKEKIYKIVKADSVKIHNGLAMIAIVGRGVRREREVAMRAFSALTEAFIDIKMIDLGSSDINIIIGVDEKDYPLALNRIYSELIGREAN